MIRSAPRRSQRVCGPPAEHSEARDRRKNRRFRPALEAPMCPAPSDPLHARLLTLARQATAQIRAAGADTAIIWLTDVRPDALVWVPLDGAHPLQLLLRFVAPSHWTAIGVAGAGSAHTLDASGRPQRGSTLGHVFVTVLVHRSGLATTLMQQG